MFLRTRSTRISFVGEHVLTILKYVADQTTKQVLDLLKIKYGRSRMEKVKDCIKTCLTCKESSYEEENEFLLAIEVLDLREKELNISMRSRSLSGCYR